MSKILFSLFALIFLASTIEAQDKDQYMLSAELTEGYPHLAESFIKGNEVEKVKRTQLITGVDSLSFTFGTFQKGESPGYYLILQYGNNRRFTAGSFATSDTTKIYHELIELKLESSTYKLAVQVQHDPATDIINYQWIDEQGISRTAKIQKMDHLLGVNKIMPHFTARSLAGKEIALADYKGKYLIINWWATSCGPCVAEMPGLNKMVEKYQSRKDVAFLAIASDEIEELERFFRKREYKYQQTYNKELTTLFGNTFPKHLIVNPEGQITYYLEGGSEDIYQQIEKSLISQLKTN